MKYKEFVNADEAKEWFKKNYADFYSDLKNNSAFKDLKAALDDYTGDMSKFYNIFLNFNDGVVNENLFTLINNYYKDPMDLFAIECKKNISLIYNSFNNIINENIILYHYINRENFDIKLYRNYIFTLNKFISTSLLRKFKDYCSLRSTKRYNLLIKIKVPKGTQCIPIGNNPNSCLEEHEILLHPKTKFIIKKKWFSLIDFIWVVECEIIK